MKLVILAGGTGTRMGAMTRTIPKPMVPIAGKPIIEWQIDLAARAGISEVIILAGYLGEVIEDYFGDGARWGVPIRYHQEREPLGTAGAVKAVQEFLNEDFLVFYGDTVIDLDLERLTAFHREKKSVATLLVHPNDHPHDSDLLELDADERIAAFHPKPHPDGAYLPNLVSAALYVLSPAVLDFIEAGKFADFGKHIFPGLVRAGHALYGYRTAEYIKDVGTPQRLAEVEADILSGRVARMNKKNRRAAIFLDRDGVLNEDAEGHIARVEDLKILAGVPEAVRAINGSDYLAVVVTNQPMLAKGFATERDLTEIHNKLETLLGRERAFLDRIYYCPHHPQRGFAGERPELKIECDCRKPAPGMVLRAAADLNIDLSQSWLIGDQTRDIMTGANAGVKTILVKTGTAGEDGKYECRPDFCFEDISAAVNFILTGVKASGS